MQREVYEHISRKTNDPIIERRKCKVSGESFAIFQSDKEFYDKISPNFNGKKYNIPKPTLCPKERQRRRMYFYNKNNLYKSKCDLSQKNIITIYNPKYGYKIYDNDEWRSDKRNALDYGIDIDFSKTFTEQFYELSKKVPRQAIINDNNKGSENCAYCQDFAYGKNCYLAHITRKIENAYYSSSLTGGNWLIDCEFVHESNNCYECINSYNLFNCFYVQESSDSSNCWFSYDLIGCKNCIFCSGLRNAKYNIFNKKYTRQDYQKYYEDIKQKLNKGGIESLKNKIDEFNKIQIKKDLFQINSINSYGNILFGAKDSSFCFNMRETKNTKYTCLGDIQTDSQDMMVGGELELCYESICTDNSYHAIASIWCWSCNNIYYSQICHNCNNCFGCISLINKKYCIFNKQYSKDEYNKLIPKLIKHMQNTGERGEFFDISLSTFSYNESIANDYYKLNEKDILSKGFKYLSKRIEINIPKGIEIIKDKKLPYNIENIGDDILEKAIICEESGRLFRIIKPELQFYRKHNLPIPRKHPDIRNKNRLNKTSKMNLYFTKCDKCGKEIISAYNQDRKFKVYCEDCYNKEIY